MKVRTIPVQPHCFLYGGFDIQMVRTNEVLRSVGVDARPLDWWSRDESFDILHVWGLNRQHHNLVRLAKDYGKKVVMTPLLPYLSPATYLRHWVGFVEGRKRIDIDILRHVDVMLVVNELQAETAASLYGFPRRSIEVIPTMLDPVFFEQTVVQKPLVEYKDYVVCAGNILPRKNQIRLAKAALEVGCSVVFAGNEMGGEDAYTEEFRQLIEANPSLKWHRWLNSEDIYKLMSNAKAIALPSFEECQPTIGLEAVALQKSLLLANRSYAYQKFYKGAALVNPKSVQSIATGLLKIIEMPNQYTPEKNLVNDCHPEIVALKLRDIFRKIISL